MIGFLSSFISTTSSLWSLAVCKYGEGLRDLITCTMTEGMRTGGDTPPNSFPSLMSCRGSVATLWMLQSPALWIDITDKCLEVLLPPPPKCAYPLSTWRHAQDQISQASPFCICILQVNEARECLWWFTVVYCSILLVIQSFWNLCTTMFWKSVNKLSLEVVDVRAALILFSSGLQFLQKWGFTL